MDILKKKLDIFLELKEKMKMKRCANKFGILDLGRIWASDVI